MDEHIILSSGKTIEMKQDCLHFDFKNLEYFINKHELAFLMAAYNTLAFLTKF